MMLAISLFFIYLVIACLLIYARRSAGVKEWWLKIVTQEPPCTYYFGPFSNSEEARNHESGYLEDLMEEGAKGISVAVQESEEPQELTIIGQGNSDAGVGSLRKQAA